MSTEEAWQRLAAEQLKAIQPADTGTTKAARIRVLLPHIEAAMARNVTQSEIISELAKSGLVMTLDELRNSLYRARKRLKKEKKPDVQPASAPVVPAPKATPAALPLPATPQQRTRPNAPAHLNWQAQRDNDKTF